MQVFVGQNLMQGNIKCGVALLLLLLVTLCACSPQKNLASRLTDADRVVVTNPSNSASITVIGEHVKKIVHALEVSRKVSSNVSATPGYRLDFFKGTNHLGTVPTSDLIFWIGKTPYHDKSGTLRALYERFWQEQPLLR